MDWVGINAQRECDGHLGFILSLFFFFMTEEQPYGQALQSSDSTAQPKPLGELAQQHIATAPHLNQGTHLEGN